MPSVGQLDQIRFDPLSLELKAKSHNVSIRGWMGKQDAMEYHSALKRKDILAQAAQWMNPKDMLSEISQTQKDKTLWFHLYETPRVVRFTETESRRGARGQGEWVTGGCWMGAEFPFGKMSSSGEDGGHGRPVNVWNAAELDTLD